MKFIFLLAVLHFSPLLPAQESIIAKANQPNLAYLGINNPLHVLADGYPCKSLFLRTDNGSIEKMGCYYNYSPSRTGTAILTIYKRQDGKSVKLKSYKWEVHPFPKPIAQVGPHENGSDVQKGSFCAQAGVAAFPPCGFGFELMFKVVSFSFIIMRDSTIQFSTQITGNLFNINIHEACKAMSTGSVVLISNIVVIGGEGKVIKVDPLEYVITN
jgi:hypothetical protein